MLQYITERRSITAVCTDVFKKHTVMLIPYTACRTVYTLSQMMTIIVNNQLIQKYCSYSGLALIRSRFKTRAIRIQNLRVIIVQLAGGRCALTEDLSIGALAMYRALIITLHHHSVSFQLICRYPHPFADAAEQSSLLARIDL